METWTREELKTRAKAAVKMYYWKMVLVSFIFSILVGGAGGSFSSGSSRQSSTDSMTGSGLGSGSMLGSGAAGNVDTARLGAVLAIAGAVFLFVLLIASLLRIFVFNLLAAGCQGFFNHSLVEEPTLNDLVGIFQGNYWNGVKVCFLKELYIFLWTLLFIIPGLIKTYEYRMVPYILAENPNMSSREIFAKSKEMMSGNKWSAFVLDLSFIGWTFLGVITLGIVYIFWVGPYICATNAALYRKLSGADYVNPYGQTGAFGGHQAPFGQSAYGQQGGYSQSQDPYNQSNTYGQSQASYDQTNTYGQSQASYNQTNTYGQPQDPNQTNTYGQPQDPNQTNTYSQSQDPYNQTNTYDQNGNSYSGQSSGADASRDTTYGASQTGQDGYTRSGYDQGYFSGDNNQ